MPELVGDIQDALIRVGRGAVADQLRDVVLARWTYDEFANFGTLYLESPRTPGLVDRNLIGAKQGETLCPSDDLAVNLELDDRGRLIAIELLDARSIIARLENGR